MVTLRDLIVATVSIAATAGVAAVAQQASQPLTATAFDWNGMQVRATAVGEVRQIVRAPTATLDELEMHVTTLKPGQTSHAPHQHPNEELLIVKDGTVEALVSGEWKRLGAGSVIFQASNQLHGIRNVGDTLATYHVINWRSPGRQASSEAAPQTLEASPQNAFLMTPRFHPTAHVTRGGDPELTRGRP